MASGISSLFATAVPTNAAVPISDGSGAANESLNDWVTSGSGGIDIQTALDALSTTQGAIIYRAATEWKALGPGVAGGFLQTNGLGNDPTWSLGGGIYDTWVAGVDAAGGTYEADSKSIAFDLSDALMGAAYFSKITYLLPLLGSNLAAFRVPLIDTLVVGPASSVGFTDTDCDQATGLQGNGTSGLLDLVITPASLVGGIGYWENNIDFGGTDSGVMGRGTAGPDVRFVIDLRSGLMIFDWGAHANRAEVATGATNGHYYGQASASNNRKLYLDAVEVASNTSSDASTPSSASIKLMGWNYAGTDYFWKGRCAVAYKTDGTLTPTEIADFHTLLGTYLITPTGR